MGKKNLYRILVHLHFKECSNCVSISALLDGLSYLATMRDSMGLEPPPPMQDQQPIEEPRAEPSTDPRTDMSRLLEDKDGGSKTDFRPSKGPSLWRCHFCHHDHDNCFPDQDDQIQAGKEGGWLGKSFLHVAWGQTGAPQWPGVIIITKIINIIINNIINIITKIIIIIIIIITTLKVRAANNADYYVSRIGKKESPVRPKQL